MSIGNLLSSGHTKEMQNVIVNEMEYDDEFFDKRLNREITEFVIHLKKTTTLEKQYHSLMILELDFKELAYSYKATNPLVDVNALLESRKCPHDAKILGFFIRSIDNLRATYPLCFYKPTISANGLTIKFKEAVKCLQRVNLLVMGVVFENSPLGIAAVNVLLYESYWRSVANNVRPKHNVIFVDEHEIIPLFNPKHLLEGLIEDLIGKNLIYERNGEKRTAKWSHIEDTYTVDACVHKEFRMLYKLTEEIVYRKHIQGIDMDKFKNLFDKPMCNVLFKLCACQCEGPDNMKCPRKGSDTAVFLLIFSKLFDSMRGYRFNVDEDDENYYNSAVFNYSPHLELWEELFHIFRKMYFQCPKTEANEVTPSIRNWIFNITAFVQLKHKSSALGYAYLLPAAFNFVPFLDLI